MVSIKTFFNSYGITFSLILVALLIVTSACLIYYNRNVIHKNLQLQNQVELVKSEYEYSHEKTTRFVDVTMRGYAIIREERYLYRSNAFIKNDMEANYHRLDSLLKLQGFNDPKDLKAVEDYKNFIRDFVTYHAEMIDLLRKNDETTFRKKFMEDKGSQLYIYYDRGKKAVYSFENRLNEEAQARYDFAMQSNIYVQILMLLVGIPTIFIVIYRLRTVNKNRLLILKEFEETTMKHLFNSGVSIPLSNSKLITDNHIRNLINASEFIGKITDGDLDAKWIDMNENNMIFNNETLAGNLIKMREQLKKVKLKDERDRWISNGLAKFSEIIRNRSGDKKVLAQEMTVFIANYLNAQYAGLSILEEEKGETPYLELIAACGFERNKNQENKITVIGEGLVGQAFSEGKTVLLADLPKDYIHISSTLGFASPNALLIVPMKYNEKIEAMMELASFSYFEEHHVLFLEKAGEYAASALLNTKANEKIKLQNIHLSDKNNEIESQNEELTQQQEEIASQRDKLTEQLRLLNIAQQTIEIQNKEIRSRNQNLEEQVETRTHELSEYNTQLEQFAFITAHNLRAPVARILGLGSVLNLHKDTGFDEKSIIDKLIFSTKELDQVIKDLNTILEVRNNYSNIINEVNFLNEVEKVKESLEREIIETNTDLTEDFSRAPVVFSFAPYIDSIIYNLISNAIKYRDPTRKPYIEIKTEQDGEYVCLSVSDNGLGINLELYREKLFTLYKRFHLHVAGKGIGLYLIKTQVLALGGKIEVESEVGKGTIFKVFIKNRKEEK